MVQPAVNRKIVRSLSKGQVTIPIEFRRKLRIGSGTLLDVSLENNRIILEPVHQHEDSLREYTDAEVSRFLSEDKLSPEIASRIRELLGAGDL